jgi:hypothetical protein
MLNLLYLGQRGGGSRPSCIVQATECLRRTDTFALAAPDIITLGGQLSSLSFDAVQPACYNRYQTWQFLPSVKSFYALVLTLTDKKLPCLLSTTL